ncbi:MAG: ABC transporter substrate-binding protein [Bradymonadaceae bacterium]
MKIARSAELPTHPLRVVSLAPNVTEILFALGAGERVVGVTRYCDYPEAVKTLPRIGGMLDPDFEAIMAARPDLVTGVIDGSDNRLVQRLDQAKIPYIFFKMDTVEETYAGLLEIGRTMDLEGAGLKAAGELEEALTALSHEFQAHLRSRDSPPRVLLVYDHQPVVAAGPGTFGHELIELTGAKNALGPDARSYPVLDIEMVIALNPDILIDATLSRSDTEVTRFWSQYPSLKAVEHERVARFGDPVLMRPGPRLAQALELIGKAISE